MSIIREIPETNNLREIPEDFIREVPEISGGDLESALQAEQDAIQAGEFDQIRKQKEEQSFQSWYSQIAKENKLDPNPDDPKHFYDYRSYFRDLQNGRTSPPQYRPEHKQYRMPDEYKLPGHPDYYTNTDPGGWTLEQAKKYVKEHPAETPDQEAQYQVFLEKKTAQIEEKKARMTGYDQYLTNQINKQLAEGKEYAHAEILKDPEKMSAFQSFAIPYTKGVAGFFTRPFGVEPMDWAKPEDMKQAAKDHPVASAFGKAIGGIAPVAAAVTLAPETLLGQLFAFGTTGYISQYGAEKTQGSLMDYKGRNERIVKTTIKSAAYAPLWFYTKAITLGGPLVSIATRGAVRATGAATIEKLGGATPQEAVMAGLMIGALSGLFELTPYAIEKINTSVKNRSLDVMAETLVKNDEELRNTLIKNYQKTSPGGAAPSEEELTKLIRAGLVIETTNNNIPISKILAAETKLKQAFTPREIEVMPAEAGQVLIPFNEGDIVRVGSVIGKISKIVGDNAIIVSTLGKEFSTALKNIQATGLLPQEIPESALKKVPEDKKDYVKQLFKIENPAAVDEFIQNDPHYQDAVQRNTALGQKTFITSLDPEQWPEYYHKYLKEKIKPEVPPAEGKPEAIIWMGLPGSAKSRLAKELKLDKTHIQIDPDDAKFYIPESKTDPSVAPHVQGESTFMADQLLTDEAIKQNKNIIWPKIGKNPKTISDIIAKFKEAGYKVSLRYNKLSVVESKKRTYKRFLEDKRLIPVDYIDKIGDLTLDKIYDIVKSEVDDYQAWDVNTKFGDPPKEIDKGANNAETITGRIGETEKLPGPGRPSGLYDAPNAREGGPAQAAAKEVKPTQKEAVKAVVAETPKTIKLEDTALQLYDSIPPEDQATWELEMDDLNKTPEGNLFVAIRTLGKIKPYKNDYLAEELKGIPASLKDKNAAHTLDTIVSELGSYGWHFEGDTDLLAEIKNQAANPVEKVNRTALRQVIRNAKKNAKLQQTILDSFKKERKFAKTVREISKTAEPVAEALKEKKVLYEPITNAYTLREAQEYVRINYNEAIDLVEGPGRASTFANAVAIVLIDQAQTEGRWADAIRLVEKTAIKNTEMGQTIQALAMYERLTPEGILQYANKQVEHAREKITQRERLTNYEKIVKTLGSQTEKDALAEKLGIPHISEVIAAELRRMAERIQIMEPGRDKVIEEALLLKKISDQIPPGLGKKIAMIQTLAQLLNPKTFIRNILGNVGFQGLENISDTLGVLLDVGTSLRTGKRTLYLPSLIVQGKGLAQGMKEGTQEALLGINLKGQQSKFTLPSNGVFDTGVMSTLEKALRISLSATDRAFYQAAFNQSIREQCRATGAEEPTEDMIEKANYLGLYRTFQDDNVISDLFVKLKRLLNLQKDFGLGDIVIKYPKTPANILARGIEYSPFGFVRTIMKLAKPLFGQEFDQEGFVRSTSRAFTGSALLVGVGAILAALGIISGKRAKDRDIAATREAVGLGEYQINVSALKRYVASGLDPELTKLREDDILATYDWFLPSSIGLALGADLVLNPKESAVNKALSLGDRILQASETLQQQPLVRGLKVLTSKENLAEGVSETFKDIPSSFMPTLLNQIRQLTDNTARSTRDPNYFKEVYNKAALRVPGLASYLEPRITPLGEEKQMYQLGTNNPFNVFLNPAFVNRYKPDPVSKMVLDIWETTGETIQFPRVAQGKIKLGAETREPVELTPAQYTDYQKYIGNKTDVLFTILADNPGFMSLPDDIKAKKLAGYLTDINTAAKVELLGYRPKNVSQDVITIIKYIGRDKREIDKNSGIREEPDIREVPEEAIRELP